MAPNSNRPLSPHLQVYKWGPHMLISILHRVAGDGMAVVGALVFLWWLGAAAAGPEAYSNFVHCIWKQEAAGLSVWNWLGRIVLIGLSWAFFQHAASGLRHLLLDTGAGYELTTNRLWSLVVAIVPSVLTAALWFFIFYRGL